MSTRDIQQVYIGLLGRAADAGGLNYWANSGFSIDEIAARIVHGADEFPQDDRPTMIAALFQNLFNRTADEADISYWEGWLDQYDASLDVLLMNLIRYPSTQDGETLNNRTIVAEAYTKTAAGTDKELDLEAAAAVIADVDHTVKSVADALATIEEAAGDPSEGLAALTAAEGNLSAFVEAWGKANGDPTADAAAVKANVDTKEAALEALIAGADGTTLGISESYDEVGDGIEQDALENARLEIIKLEIAAKKATLDAGLKTATTALNAVDATAKAAVDAYQKAVQAQTAAAAAVAPAEAGIDSAAAALVEQNATVTAVTWTEAAGEYTITITVNGTPGAVTYDSEDKTFDFTANPAAQTLNLTDLQSKLDTHAAALIRVEQADTAVNNRLEALADVDATLVDDDTDPTAIAGPAEDYVDALDALDVFAKALANFDKAVAAVSSARADAVEVASLEKAVADAEESLEKQGFAVVTLEDADIVFATADSDIFIVSALKAGESAEIFDLGFAGNDAIFVGEAYTLGADIKNGNDSVLELFIQQQGASTVVTFETKAFGSSAANPEWFEVELVGVNATDVTFADGYITVA